MFNIDEILKAVSGKLLCGDKDAIVRSVSIDSRAVEKNSLFVAIKGKRFDGHDFAADAAKKGASALIVSKDIPLKKAAVIRVADTLRALGDIAAYHRMRFDIPVVGVTGSNGKTTVKEMLWHILERDKGALKNKGTQNNLVGLPMALLGLGGSHSFAVLEMGANQPGEIDRLAAILKPTAGLITNIGPAHLEFLKDKEGVLRAKSELVRHLGAKDLLILNGDDEMLMRIRPKCRRVTFGTGRRNDFRASDIRMDGSISFTLNGIHPIKINLLGMHNVYNGLAAVSAASSLGVDIPAIRGALSDFRPPPMRMELLDINGLRVINDAYNSNPMSFKCAIKALRAFKTKGNKIIVSGDMLELGSRGRYFHNLAGRMIAGESINALITVGELSRYTASAAKKAGMRRNLWPCADTDEAAAVLRRIAKPGDAVLIKGSRGMALERIIKSL